MAAVVGIWRLCWHLVAADLLGEFIVLGNVRMIALTITMEINFGCLLPSCVQKSPIGQPKDLLSTEKSCLAKNRLPAKVMYSLHLWDWFPDFSYAYQRTSPSIVLLTLTQAIFIQKSSQVYFYNCAVIDTIAKLPLLKKGVSKTLCINLKCFCVIITQQLVEIWLGLGDFVLTVRPYKKILLIVLFFADGGGRDVFFCWHAKLIWNQE